MANRFVDDSFDFWKVRQPRARMAQDDDARWITIGGGEAGGAKHAGGTPVMIDKHGAIVGGPDALVGKSLDNLSGDADSKPKRKPRTETFPLHESLKRPEWLDKPAVARTQEEDKLYEQWLKDRNDALEAAVKREKDETRARAEKRKKPPEDPASVSHDEFVATHYLAQIKQLEKDHEKLKQMNALIDKQFTPEGLTAKELKSLESHLSGAAGKRLRAQYSYNRRFGNPVDPKEKVSTYEAMETSGHMLASAKERYANGWWGDSFAPKDHPSHAHLEAVKKKFEETGEITPENIRHYWYRGDWIRNSPHKDVILRYHVGEAIENANDDRKGKQATFAKEKYGEFIEPHVAKVRTRLAEAMKDAAFTTQDEISARRDAIEQELAANTKIMFDLDQKYGYSRERIKAMVEAGEQVYADWQESDRKARTEAANRNGLLISEQLKLRDKSHRLAEDGRAWVLEHFAAPRPGEITHKEVLADQLSSAGAANLEEAKKFVAALYPEAHEFRVELLRQNENRANAMLDKINVLPSEPTSTFIHEIGHTIEHANKYRLAGYARAFYWKSIGDDAFEHGGANYEPSEVMVKDGFLNAYTGKYYPASTEILSMGLQHLYENPFGFAAKSPEHFAFTIAALQEI